MAKKILVVDDEHAILDLIVMRLRDSGYECFAALDGFQAVKIAHDQRPDLIIMDVKMPAGGGEGAYENLKKSMHTSFIPIIFITAYDSETVRQRVFAKGARDFIAKPFKNEELISKVRKALGEPPLPPTENPGQ